ncbi:MAG: PspC domain-containing protein [Alloprevotella sp.]|nr:PspC domain-containing protein [Alloprevotella sp.]
MQQAPKRLVRSRDQYVAGVCGGIAEYIGADPSIVRAAYALLTFFSAAFPGLILYIIMWAVMPKE